MHYVRVHPKVCRLKETDSSELLEPAGANAGADNFAGNGADNQSQSSHLNKKVRAVFGQRT